MPAVALLLFSELSFQQAILQTWSVSWTSRSKGRKYFTLRCEPHRGETMHNILVEYKCWWEVIKNSFPESKSTLASLSAHNIFYWAWNLMCLTILSFVLDRVFSLFITICVSAYFWLKAQTQRLCERIEIS